MTATARCHVAVDDEGGYYTVVTIGPMSKEQAKVLGVNLHEPIRDVTAKVIGPIFDDKPPARHGN